MNEDNNISTVTWIFGRGATISCGLNWFEDPGPKTRSLDRDIRIKNIRANILQEEKRIKIGRTSYSKLLSILKTSTNPLWKHLFITTNWDSILDKEIENMIRKEEGNLHWLPDSWGFHLNGSTKEPQHDTYSQFLLDDDSWDSITDSYERAHGLWRAKWERGLIVIVGLSFNYGIDKFLLKFWQTHQDNLPFGESNLLILNPQKEVCDNIKELIEKAFPRASVFLIAKRFGEWVNKGMPELVNLGILMDSRSTFDNLSLS